MKAVCSVFAAIALVASLFYAVNYDMYKRVGTDAPVRGYKELVTHLQDEEWAADLENSSSPLLRSTYLWLTGQSDVSPVGWLQFGRLISGLWYTTTLACAVVFIFYTGLNGAERSKAIRHI